MPLYDRDGRLRILFTDAYEKLARRGAITPEQAETVKDLVDRLEEFTPQELEGRLAALFPAAERQGGPTPGGTEVRR